MSKMLIKEVAARLGVSVQAVHARAKRKAWPSETLDGKLWVEVPPEVVAQFRPTDPTWEEEELLAQGLSPAAIAKADAAIAAVQSEEAFKVDVAKAQTKAVAEALAVREALGDPDRLEKVATGLKDFRTAVEARLAALGTAVAACVAAVNTVQAAQLIVQPTRSASAEELQEMIWDLKTKWRSPTPDEFARFEKRFAALERAVGTGTPRPPVYSGPPIEIPAFVENSVPYSPNPPIPPAL